MRLPRLKSHNVSWHQWRHRRVTLSFPNGDVTVFEIIIIAVLLAIAGDLIWTEKQ